MKKVKASACMFLGIICLPAAGAESGNFIVQVIVNIAAACLFALFFGLAADLLADNKETKIDVRKMRPLHADGKCSAQGLENHRVYISM